MKKREMLQIFADSLVVIEERHNVYMEMVRAAREEKDEYRERICSDIVYGENTKTHAILSVAFKLGLKEEELFSKMEEVKLEKARKRIFGGNE